MYNTIQSGGAEEACCDYITEVGGSKPPLANISFNQLNSALGFANIPLHEKFLSNVLETARHINQASISTFLFFLCVLILLFVLKRFFNKIPGIILMTPVCILVGFLSSKSLFPIVLQTLDSKFPNINKKI